MRKLLGYLLCLLSIAVVAPAHAAITYVGTIAVPADPGTHTGAQADSASAIAIPTSSLTFQPRDLLIAEPSARASTATIGVVGDGGQSWTCFAQSTAVVPTKRMCWAQFDGTWDADPTFSSGDNGAAYSIYLTVYRPTSTSYVWALDVAYATTYITAPSSPFDVTIASQTPTVATGTVTHASWTSNQESVGWALQTGGWSQPQAYYTNTTGTGMTFAFAYKIQSSTSPTAAVVNRTGGNYPTVTSAVTFREALPVPVFTSGPAIGTRTTSSIPVDFTADTTGTVYGARLTDGSATPTCDQLEAETATGGLTYWSEAVVATVADSHSFTGLTSGTVVDGYFCIEDASGNDSAVATIANMYKLPAFTVAPSVISRTASAYTVGETLDGAGTVYLAACAKDASPASVAQVEAGAGGCITVAASEAVTGADTQVLGGSLTLPLHDIYVVGVYGSQHEAAVHMLADEQLDAPAGYLAYLQLETIGSQANNLVKVFNAAESPDIVSGDYETCTDATDPDNYVTTIYDDGNIFYDGPQTAQLVKCRYYDVSAGAWHAAASPSVEAEFYINWLPPSVGSGSLTLGPFLTGDAIATSALSDGVTDPQDSALTFTVTTGTLPAGLSMDAAGNITGTPTVADVDGIDIVVTVTNQAGLTATISVRFYILTTVPAPNCVGGSLVSCESLLLNANAGLTLDTVTFVCGTAEQSGLVDSQAPAANDEVDPFATFDLVIFKRCGLGIRRLGIGLGVGVGP